MLIQDSTYSWEGWGGKLQLANGKCRLRIFDRKKSGEPVTILRPFVIIVSDVPDSKMSVRSCAGHIATKVTNEFKINPNRMMWIEYYPAVHYGRKNEYKIEEQYILVDFTWKEGRALHPKWRPMNPPLLDTIRTIMESEKNEG
jgi:hypothetical protein